MRSVAQLFTALGVSAVSAASLAVTPTTGAVSAPPAIEAPQLSPDGRSLLFVRRPQPDDPDSFGDAVVIVDLSDMDSPSSRPLSAGDNDILWASFANNERLLMAYSGVANVADQDIIIRTEDGLRHLLSIERSHILSVRLDGSEGVRLFGDQGRRFNRLSNHRQEQIVDFLPDDPDHVLAPARTGSNNLLRLYRVNVNTGRASHEETGGSSTVAFFTNDNGEAVMRLDAASHGDEIVMKIRSGDGRRWRNAARMPTHEFGKIQREMSWVGRAAAHDQIVVFARSPRTDRIGVFAYSLTEDRLAEPLFEHERYDVSEVYIDPFTHAPFAVRWADERTHLEILDPMLAPAAPLLRDAFGEDAVITPLQRSGDRVLVETSGPQAPRSFHVFDLSTSQLVTIGPQRQFLASARLGPVSIHHYTARDGTELFGYLTRPADPLDPAPSLVVLPHGGPEWRDYHAFDSWAQLIAAQGHLVFQPQFRGSFGFGRGFAEAGYGRWGDLIQHDITDGVRSLIEAGMVDPERICVVGWSFGGYSALMQPINEPGLYQCAVAGAPVTDLPALLAYAEEEAGGPVDILRRMLGADNAQTMEAFSPTRRAGEIGVPVLLAHGAEDSVAPVEQSELMADALRAAGADYDYLELRGGHTPGARDLHAFMTRVDTFLDTHIGTGPAVQKKKPVRP